MYLLPSADQAARHWLLAHNQTQKHPRLLVGPDCSLTLMALQQVDDLAVSRYKCPNYLVQGGESSYVTRQSRIRNYTRTDGEEMK